MDDTRKQPTNAEIAETFERIADLLEAQRASVYRVRAYRAGARTVRSADKPVAEMVDDEPPHALEDLPAIGKSLAAVIREYVTTGRSSMLERIEGETSPADLFATVPGIGEELAERIEHELHLETLEDLEAAAHDGRLDALPGFGPRRVRGVQETLGHLLRHASSRRARSVDRKSIDDRPSISALLETDRLYKEQSGMGKLRMIAPRRFNPERRAWLPVLHCEVDGWSMTAMFSNTARAHQLGRTGEWVVVYFERDGIEGQCTIVNEHSGALKGKRVVRGRESECAEYYRSIQTGEPGSSRAKDA